MWDAVLAGQQGEDGALQERRDPVSHWLPKLCAHICYLSAPGLGSWVLALSCWLCPGQGGRRRLGGRRRIVPSCVCMCPGGGAVWACLMEGHMPASRRSTVGFALACVPTRLPVWLGYKRPRSTGGGSMSRCSWLGRVSGHVLELCVVPGCRDVETVSDCRVLWAGMPIDAGLCVHRELFCVCVGRRLGCATRMILGVLACCVRDTTWVPCVLCHCDTSSVVCPCIVL